MFDYRLRVLRRFTRVAFECYDYTKKKTLLTTVPGRNQFFNLRLRKSVLFPRGIPLMSPARKPTHRVPDARRPLKKSAVLSLSYR